MFFTVVAKGTASVTGGRQLTMLMPSTQEYASGHGFSRQSSQLCSQFLPCARRINSVETCGVTRQNVYSFRDQGWEHHVIKTRLLFFFFFKRWCFFCAIFGTYIVCTKVFLVRQMECFLNRLNFSSHIHLVKRPEKAFGKAKKNLKGDRTDPLSITFKQTCLSV